MSEVLSIDNVSKRYEAGESTVEAVRGVSLRVDAGGFVAIMGASGSGKSTLLHLVGGLDEPTSGTVHIRGRDIGAMRDAERTVFRRRHLGFVFQSFHLLPTLTALENVALPAVIDNRNGTDVTARAEKLLHDVGMGHRLRHRPQALSGGEQQRVAIARALMNDPVLILADEPTGNLDTRHGAAIWSLFRELTQEQGRTVVAITHEAAGASYAEVVLYLRDGRMVGSMQPDGEDHAAMVASRYAELAY